MKRVILSLTTFFMIFTPAALMAQWRDGYGCFGFGRHFGYFGGGIMMIMILIILALFIFFAIKMIRSQVNPFASDPAGIAKARYAKGEITNDQLQEIIKNLQ